MQEQQKPVRKLRLAKESLRPLGDAHLSQVHGGATITLSIVLSCMTVNCEVEDSTGSFSCGKVGVCC